MNLKLIILLLVLGIFCGKFGLSLQQNGTTIVKYFEPKIVGGVDASLKGNEHIVSIRLRSIDNIFGRGHICGGSLINSTTVLTAAHCFLNLDYRPPKLRKASEFKVAMGTLDKRRITVDTFTSNIKAIVLHQNFSINTMVNDIGLMILSKEVPKNHRLIKAIPLANKLPSTGAKCRVDGWGALKFTGNGPNRLQTVNISIIDMTICNRNYKYRLKKGMFCAGNLYGGQDSCQGDSGGPLTYNGTLIGVVSWGDKCGFPGLPGIYTDVSYFQNWIRTSNSSNKTITIFYSIIFVIICQIFILN